jgi:glycosyltransferase involved in cell wall biosynthesis
MKYYWIGKHLNSTLFYKYSKNGYKDPAAYNSQKNFLEGLRKYINIDSINVINFPLKYKNLFEKDEIWFENGNKNTVLNSVNIPILRMFFSSLFLLFELIKIKFLIKNEKMVLISYGLQSTLLLPVFILKFFDFQSKVSHFSIVPDLPFYMSGKLSLIRFIFKSLDSALIKICLIKTKGFILYSSHMKEFFPKKANSIVIEGSVKVYDTLDYINSNFEKYILCIGNLDNFHGLDIFLNAIRLTKGLIFMKFIFCGFGVDISSIIELSKFDSRIEYHGFLSEKDLTIMKNNAFIHLNLRNPNFEMSRFSFPSKILELMLSGRPVITPKLKGIPVEYHKYLYTIEEFNPSEIASKIISLSKLNKFEKALKAKDFVIEQKNHLSQSKKLLSFIHNLL